MRANVIELLELPRRLIRGQVFLETCDHAGLFSPGDPECLVCETRMECEWLYHNDEFATLSEKPVDDLLHALESSVVYVDACITHARHDRRKCRCELCQWLQRVQRMGALDRLGGEDIKDSALHGK